MFKLTHIQCSHSPSGPSSKIHCRFFYSPTFYVVSFILCWLCVMHSLFLVHHFIFRHRLYQLPPLCVVHYVQFHCFPIFFSEVSWNTTHSLSIHFYCVRGTRKLAKKKTQKRLYFFRTYTPWCICVFFSMNLYNLLR